MMNKEVDIRPSLGEILNGYERQNYKPETALAEFVDNSTASYFQNKLLLQTIYSNQFKLNIEISYNSGTKTLTIKDNAFGMDLETFKNALTIAKRPKIQGGRNEYGMGLKTAASWFGKRWTVTTTTYSCDKEYFAEIDINKLIETKENIVNISEHTISDKKHGTTISIMELTRRITPSSLMKLKDDLESIYRRDLNSGDINIFIDGVKLSYNEPKVLVEYIDNKEVTWKQDFDTILSFDGVDYKLSGFCALRQEGSYKDAGFTLFRKNRVIIGGVNKGFKPDKIFKAANSFMSLRLFGEVNLDDWPVTQSKDDFDWELSGLKDAFIDKLYEISEKYIKKAQEFRVAKKVNDAKLNSSEVKQFADDTIIDISKVNPEKIKIIDTTPKIETNTIHEETNSSYTVRVQVLNSIYKVKVKFINDITDELLKVNDIDDSIDITLNSAFPLLSEMENNRKFINLLQKYLVVLVLSEKYASKLSTNSENLIKPYSIREIMNQILMEISQNKDSYYEEYDN